jgi:nucleoside phosphorylase
MYKETNMRNQPPTQSAVIFTALALEYQAVRSHIDDLHDKEHPEGNVYEQGTFTSPSTHWQVGLVQTQMGTARAAFEAGRAIDYFKPSLVFFVGIAGGLKDVHIGDVVAATKVYGYESGKATTTFQPRPETGIPAFRLVQRALAEARGQQWLQRLQPSTQLEQSPRVHVAPIAAGEKVIASTRSTIWKFLRQQYGDAVAVEMEGYGFLQAVYGYQNVEALVVRGISDLVDKKSEADATGTQEMAARHASAFAFEVLAKMVPLGQTRAPTSNKQSPKTPPGTTYNVRVRTTSGSIISPIGSGNSIINNYYPTSSSQEQDEET